jgi:hypothetical protein
MNLLKRRASRREEKKGCGAEIHGIAGRQKKITRSFGKFRIKLMGQILFVKQDQKR